MQAADVQALIADEHQNRSRADRVDHHMSVAAPGGSFAQCAVANLAGHALSQRQPGGRQRGEIVRVDTTGVFLDDQAVATGHRRPGDPGYAVSQSSHLREQRVLTHAGLPSHVVCYALSGLVLLSDRGRTSAAVSLCRCGSAVARPRVVEAPATTTSLSVCIRVSSSSVA
jgi:hypothetical protein